MGSFYLIFVTLCAIFPNWVVLTALAIIAITLILFLFKLVAFVLDAIPFL